MRTTVLTACLALAVSVPTTLSAAPGAADQEMAQRIGGHLKDSGQLQDYRIAVKYQDGVAWLNGSVASPQQRAIAERLARQMRGISHVVNNLSISGPTSGNGSPEMGQSPGNDMQRAQQTASTRQARPSMNQRNTYLPKRQPAARRPVRPANYNNTPRPMSARPIRQVSAQNYPAMQAQCAGGGCAPGAGGMGGYGAGGGMGAMNQGPMPSGYVPGGQTSAVNYDNAQMPGYAWPSYASYPNYAALTYPQQYSPSAWPYIGPFYPYPQVPLGWRKVSLEWDDGWWFLDFSDVGSNH